MFGLFAKNRFKREDFVFFKKVMDDLPDKYSYLRDQINPEFILGKKKHPMGFENAFTLQLNAELESKFSNANLPELFLIQGIHIWNNLRGEYEELEIHVVEGMFSGFRLKSNYSDLNIEKMDMSQIHEKQFK